MVTKPAGRGFYPAFPGVRPPPIPGPMNFLQGGGGAFLGDALADFGYGLTQGGFDKGFEYAGQRTAQMQPARSQEAENRKALAAAQEEQNATIEWLKSNYPQFAGLPPAQGFNAAMALMGKTPAAGVQPTDDIQEFQFAKENGFTGTFAEWMQTGRNGAAGPQLGLQPQWGIGADGKPVLGQISSDGRFVPTTMPEGVSPMDPATAAGNKAGAVVDKKKQAEAAALLPGAEQALTITRDAIDAIRNETAGMSEQFGNILGVPQQMLPTIPGTKRANFQVLLEQASGQAFMQARQMLKGGGQITDYEGRRGEAAYARMTVAAEKGDQQSFMRALEDFEKAVEDGYQKLLEYSSGTYAPTLTPNTGGAAPVPGGQTSTGIPWTVEGL